MIYWVAYCHIKKQPIAISKELNLPYAKYYPKCNGGEDQPVINIKYNIKSHSMFVDTWNSSLFTLSDFISEMLKLNSNKSLAYQESRKRCCFELGRGTRHAPRPVSSWLPPHLAQSHQPAAEHNSQIPPRSALPVPFVALYHCLQGFPVSTMQGY